MIKIGSKLNISYFSEKLKNRRNELGLTQKSLSEKSTVSTKTINSWENMEGNSKYSPSVHNIISLCDTLDCDIEYLFSEQKIPHKETADIMKITGLSEKAAEKLKKNAGGYWEALSSVLENETFWQFLKIMETYKMESNDPKNTFSIYDKNNGKYQIKNRNELKPNDNVKYTLNTRLKSITKMLLPDAQHNDTDIFTDEYFRSICTRYCWQLMSDYKKEVNNGDNN